MHIYIRVTAHENYVSRKCIMWPEETKTSLCISSLIIPAETKTSLYISSLIRPAETKTSLYISSLIRPAETKTSLYISSLIRAFASSIIIPICMVTWINSLVQETKIAEFANSADLNEVAHNEPPHKIYTVCPLVFEFSVWYSLDLTFFKNLQTKILSSAFWYLKS